MRVTPCQSALVVFALFGATQQRAFAAAGPGDGAKRKRPGAYGPAHASAPTPPRSALALQMPGQWRWATGVLVDIFPNGTMRGDNKEEGAWAVSNETGRQVQLKWNAGWLDTVTVAADGNAFHGSNQHGTQVNATRVLTPAPSSPVPSGPSAPPVPPSSPPEKRDCGTGVDPGCDTMREGKGAMLAEVFNPLLKLATAERSDLTRRELVIDSTRKHLLTAKQLTTLLDLFRSELNKMDVARAAIPNVVDAPSLLGYASGFRSSINRKEFVKLVNK